MYWVNRPNIDRAAMDGSNQTTIIRSLTNPWAITIDYTENRLYYSDNDGIYSSDMLGNNTQLVKPGDGGVVRGIAADADYIYWINEAGQVTRQKKLSKSSMNQTVLVDSLTYPTDIFLPTASPPNVTNERETRPETCIGLSGPTPPSPRKIIDQESRNPHRKIKEAVHIQLEGAKLNRTEGWELPKTYLPLLRREATGGGTRQTDASLGPSLARLGHSVNKMD
ncbi:hypothetical protein Bbelb_018820 [Branchiostoma belcheri]|nr:hypothetical protein Bbelb_018820 [Branchiostoma belcheri]